MATPSLTPSVAIGAASRSRTSSAASARRWLSTRGWTGAAYFDTEELWFPEHDHLGTPWTNQAGYEQQNPVSFVQNWKAPILVVHGAKDFRIVDTEGMSTFTAAQRRGVPSRLLYFPAENHWVVKPRNTILWHDTVLDWLRQWTKPAAASEKTPSATAETRRAT